MTEVAKKKPRSRKKPPKPAKRPTFEQFDDSETERLSVQSLDHELEYLERVLG